MRRADRLFRIVEYLKARRTVVKAQDLADEMEVSLRTIYRDMADLMQSGAPIFGEAGMGYVLDKSHLVRPLMFDLEELDAILLGARMVESWGDNALQKSARAALDKIRAVLPVDVFQQTAEEFLFAYPTQAKPTIRIDFSAIRRAIRVKRMLQFTYINAAGESSHRQIRPLALVFFAPVCLLVGWCEMRADFRNFRLDRMADLNVLEATFRDEKGKRLRDYKVVMEADKNGFV